MGHTGQFDVADIESAPCIADQVRSRHRLADIGVRPVQRRKRFEFSVPMSRPARPARARAVVFDGIDNRLIAGTAAIIAGKMLANLLSIRPRSVSVDPAPLSASPAYRSRIARIAFPECCLQIGNLRR
jgi:hypothetical protein